MIRPIALDDLTVIGEGVNRPETVLVTGDDRIIVSDSSDSALTEILPDGSLRRLGHRPGESNGLAVLDTNTIVFTVFDTAQVCTLDLINENVTVLADEVDGTELSWPNFPVTAPDGTTWVTRTTTSDSPFDSIDGILHDGSIVRIDSNGKTTTVATGIPFANCMAFDAQRHNLFVVRSTLSDVGQYELAPDGGLLDRGRYGPVFGQRCSDEVGPGYAQKCFEPTTGRRWALTDGCAFDAEGNLWVTLMTANKIVAITPDGNVVTVVDDPEGKQLIAPTSVTWGGPDLQTLYIGSLVAPYVLTARSPVPGQPLWHQDRS